MEPTQNKEISQEAQTTIIRLGTFLEGVKGEPIDQAEFVAFLTLVEEESDHPVLLQVIDEIHHYIQTKDPKFMEDNTDIDWWRIAEKFYDGTFFTKSGQ